VAEPFVDECRDVDGVTQQWAEDLHTGGGRRIARPFLVDHVCEGRRKEGEEVQDVCERHPLVRQRPAQVCNASLKRSCTVVYGAA
jgi:hypothetical protein